MSSLTEPSALVCMETLLDGGGQSRKGNDNFNKQACQNGFPSLKTKIVPAKGNGARIIPFDPLPGEKVEQKSIGKNASVFLTNYRLFVCFLQSFLNIPRRVIEYVEMRELTALSISCKDGKTFRLAFDNTEDCTDWWRFITSSDASGSIENIFAFIHFEHAKSKFKDNPMESSYPFDHGGSEADDFIADIRRMGFNTKTVWRITEVNTKFEVCKSYPKLHIVPALVTDRDVETVAQFRSMRRFPSVVWRKSSNGAVIARSSQPEVGWLGWRCSEDEAFLPAIAQAANLDSSCVLGAMTSSVSDPNVRSKPLLLIDARSYAAAVANRAKGGGCECQEYYPNCEIQFMGLVNIHGIRKSFQAVRTLCQLGQDQANWHSAMEATRWLHYLSSLIRSSLVIVDGIEQQARSVLVHCSDGWDRTAQLAALAELLLDPFYRTMQGFKVLIQREWVEFGHKFADRCGHSSVSDANERSPVFLQWLDAVHQVTIQFPTAFEFNELFLVKLVQHAYSCLFGTFLCNNSHERQSQKIKSRTCSLWEMLLSGRKDFYNYLYNPCCKVLYPQYFLKNMHFWEAVFVSRLTEIGDGSVESQQDVEHLEFQDSGNFTCESSAAASSGLEPSCISSRTYCAPVAKFSKAAVAGVSNGFSDLWMNGSYVPSPSIHEVAVQGESIADSCCSTEVETASAMERSHSGSDDVRAMVTSEIEEILESVERASIPKLKISNVHSSPVLTNLSEGRSPMPLTDSSVDVAGGAVDDDAMVDSVSTLTEDVEQPSVDLKALAIETERSVLHRSTIHHRVISSESPNMQRHQRRRSFPDNMNSSWSSSSDVAKSQSSSPSEGTLPFVGSLIDTDGLTCGSSLADARLLELDRIHQADLAKLQRKLDLERQARLAMLRQIQEGAAPLFSDCHDEVMSLPESSHGVASSVSSVSNDEGWEKVQIDDVTPTRWIPDHATSNCANCGVQFGIVVRRHHCRKCGRVFCSSCSDHQLSVPEENLYEPVRVCTRCYGSHTSRSRICST